MKNCYIKRLKQPVLEGPDVCYWIIVLENNKVRRCYTYSTYKTARLVFFAISRDFYRYFDLCEPTHARKAALRQLEKDLNEKNLH